MSGKNIEAQKADGMEAQGAGTDGTQGTAAVHEYKEDKMIRKRKGYNFIGHIIHIDE